MDRIHKGKTKENQRRVKSEMKFPLRAVLLLNHSEGLTGVTEVYSLCRTSGQKATNQLVLFIDYRWVPAAETRSALSFPPC